MGVHVAALIKGTRGLRRRGRWTSLVKLSGKNPAARVQNPRSGCRRRCNIDRINTTVDVPAFNVDGA